MTAIATTTSATPTEGFGARYLDRCQNGVLWSVHLDGATTDLKLYYSTDNGATWNAGGAVQVGATVIDGKQASLFIDLDDFAHVVFKATSATGGLTANSIYYVRGTPNAGRTAWTWSAAVLIFSTANPNLSYPDVVAFRDPTSGWQVAIVASYLSGTNNVTAYCRVPISAAGAVGVLAKDGLATLSGGAGDGILGGPYTVARDTYPSIDFNHTGDGKTVAGGTPHLYIGWNASTGGGVRFRKAVYAAGAWTFNAERTLDANRQVTGLGAPYTAWHVTFFDGTRAVTAGQVYNNGTGQMELVVLARDAADTATTITSLLSAATPTANAMDGGSASYDSAGNVYLFGADNTGANGTRQLNARKWTRATTTLGAIVTLETTAPNDPQLRARRGAGGSAVDVIYTDGTASPFTVTFLRAVVLNVAPNASTGLTPATGTVDRTAIQRLAWTFSDPDPGDTQSASEVQWRLGGGAWSSVPQTSPNAYWDAPAGTFPAGTIEWQVRTTDALGLVGPWSASAFFTAASPPVAPVITAPVNGSTIASNAAVATWTTPAQSDYQVRTVADAAGAPNTGVVYTDSGIITDAAARTRSLAFAVNNRFEHVQVRVRTNGLWSTWASVRVQISFTPPPVPTLVAAANGALGAIAVTITNPAPGGGEPALAYNDLYRRVAGVGAGVRIGTGLPSGVFTDRTPASGVAYEYLARAVATNGTTRDSAWTT